MAKAIVIVTKNSMKYTIGSEKTVSEVLNEINSSEGAFYQVIDQCAIRIDEITSVEQFEVVKEEVKEDD